MIDGDILTPILCVWSAISWDYDLEIARAYLIAGRRLVEVTGRGGHFCDAQTLECLELKYKKKPFCL